MKRGFIRALWGINNIDRNERQIRRKFRVDKNVQAIKLNKFNEPFVVYVMGQDNFDCMSDMGFDCKMVVKEPYMFDLVKHTYRNKLEIIKYAMEEDGYDELIYLDWDCVPLKRLPSTFWEKMSLKKEFQATLQLYRQRKAFWRDDEQRKVPNGGFIYLRDKSLPRLAIEWWEKLGSGDNDEPAWAKVTDDMTEGWKGIENYWGNFEAMFCNLHKNSPYSQDLLDSKDVCFIHYQGTGK